MIKQKESQMRNANRSLSLSLENTPTSPELDSTLSKSHKTSDKNRAILPTLNTTILTETPHAKNRNNRTAFTMIELVFIVVILGFLASIAVPKMSASREDAIVATYKQDIDTIVKTYIAHTIA